MASQLATAVAQIPAALEKLARRFDGRLKRIEASIEALRATVESGTAWPAAGAPLEAEPMAEVPAVTVGIEAAEGETLADLVAADGPMVNDPALNPGAE